MKRKVNSRTLTLILLIGALICAVFAGLAFANLFDSKSKNVDTASAVSSLTRPYWDSSNSSLGTITTNAFSKDTIVIPKSSSARTLTIGGWNALQYNVTVSASGGISVSGDTVTIPANFSMPNATITFTIKKTYNHNWSSGAGTSPAWLYIRLETPISMPTLQSKSCVWSSHSQTLSLSSRTGIIVSSLPTGWNISSTTGVITIPAKTAVGSYSIVVGPDIDQGYKWTDGTTTAKTLKFSITKAGVATPWPETSKATWSTSAQTFKLGGDLTYVSVSLPTGWTRSGTTVTIPANTSAGDYAITFIADSNHNIYNGSNPNTYMFTIERAAISMPALSASSKTWSSNSQTVSLSTLTYVSNVVLPSGWTRSGSTITIPASKAVGTYNIGVVPDDNHCWSGGSIFSQNLSISITRAAISVPTLSNTSLAFSTSSQTFTLSTMTYIASVGLPNSSWSRSGTTVTVPASTQVGSYNLSVTPDSNHCWSDNSTTAKNIAFAIIKATPTANPTVAAGTYVAGNPLSSVGISGTGNVSGTFYWTDPSTILSLGSAKYEWTFEPADTHNYNNVTGNATVAAVGMDYITVTGAKVKYKAYESFTQTGMVVNAVAGSTSRPVTGYTLDIPYVADGRSYFLVSDSGCEVVITYSEGGKTATAKLVITVEKADYDMSGVSMSDAAVTYDGNSHSITYTGDLPTGVHFNKYTYDGDAVTGATKAGTYVVEVQFTIDDEDNYNVPELSATLVIKKATPTAIANVISGYYYVGDTLSGVTITVGTSSVGGTIAWTNASGTITGVADSYGWTFVPADTDNYTNATGTVQVTAYYKLTGITVTGAKTSYKAHESFDTTGMVVTASYATGKSETAVTDYTITYPTAGATEFVITDNGKSITVTYSENGKTATAQITITVNANEYDMSGVSMDDLTVTYDKDTHSITVEGTLPDGVTVTGYTYNGVAGTGATNAGTYEVVAVITIADPDNYKIPSLSATLTINKATATLDVSGVKTDYVYNGSQQTVDSGATVDNDEQTIIYADNTFTTVAEGNGLTVNISVAESDNYLAASVTVTITVAKATPVLDVSGVKTDYVYTGEEQTIDSGATVDNDEQTIIYADNTFTTVAEGNGLTVKISVEESDNYLADEKEVQITVDKATVENSVTFTDKTVTYNGKTHTLTVEGSLADDITVTYYYYGTTDEFTGETNVKYDGADVAGYKVTVHFECTSGNYYDPTDMSATLTINPYAVQAGEVGNVESEYAYKGEAWKPEPEVKVTLADGEVTLEDSLYTVSYSTEDYVAGTNVTVTVEFDGNYSGVIEKEFEITKAELEIEWSESASGYTYNGMRQGVSVASVKGLAAKDAALGVPTVKYVGRGSTSYEENVLKPTNAGLYTVTAELDASLFDNYEYSADNVLSKQFSIKKADVTVSVDFKTPVSGTLYAGGGLPEIEIKGVASAGSLTVTGAVVWQQAGDEPPALDLGANDYVWIFTPDDDDNFNVKTGTINITAEQATVISLSVAWRDDIEIPEIYTTTKLSEIRQYLKVTGELAGNQGTVDIVGYQITGSWGNEQSPAIDKAGTYFYTVAFNGKRATLLNVVYNAILIVDLKVEASSPDGIKKVYDGLDSFDRSSIKVTVVYNDGTEVEDVQDYKIVYQDDRDKLWAGDTQVIISYNNGSLSEDMQRVIDGLTVRMKDYDTSSITVEDYTTDYDGSVKSYAIKGEFTVGTVTYTYAVLNSDGEWQTVSSAAVINAGTYRVTVKFTLEGEENIANYYDVATRQITLTVNKVDYSGVENITLGSDSVDYDFGNSVASKITLENVPDGVECVYEYKNSEGQILTAEEVVNAGSYTVTVSFVVDGNHYSIAPVTAEFTINKLSPAINPTVGGSLSQGTRLYQLTFITDDGAVAGTFKWVNDEQELKAGINRCYYVFTPDDNVNFETVKDYIDLNVGAVAEEGSQGGNVSAGLIAAISIAIAVAFLISLFALIIAVKSRNNAVPADDGGFYENASEDDLK